MAEEGHSRLLYAATGNGEDSSRQQNTCLALRLNPVCLRFLKDDVYQALTLSRHFLMEGKGRPPDCPRGLTTTNKLLLQLYVLKEETHHSFNDLRRWLMKLVPSTETVTEGRIGHRISTLLTLCDSLPEEGSQALLEEQHDFHAVAQPLTGLGLNRLHLTNVCQFHGSPLDNVSNDVVLALEMFRSRNRKPTTFVNRWLNVLCSPCNNLTPKQLKSKVEKVVKKAKDLRKRRDMVGLSAFCESFFLSDPIPSPIVLKCKDCDSLVDSLKCKDSQIKELQKQKEISAIQLQELTIKSNVIQEDLMVMADLNAHAQAKITSLAAEQRSLKGVNVRLELENKKLEEQIETLKNKSRTYKTNTLLRTENEDLANKVGHLENYVEKLKEKASDANVFSLKRKVESEQARYSKWKAEYKNSKTLRDSVAVDETSFDDPDEPTPMKLSHILPFSAWQH